MVNWNETLTTTEFTWSYSKLSCWRGAYFAHVIFCYFVFLSGLGCLVTRVWQRFKWTHLWFGRAYILSMLWATASSLIIHNSGLPVAVLWSFLWVMGGMTIGWIIINVYQIHMQRQALHAIALRIKAQGGVTEDLEQMIAAEKGRIASSKTFMQRFISLKALHGLLMFTSWINIVGRIFASDQSGDFTCHTQPVYKPLDTKHFAGLGKPLTLVEFNNPSYARLPWARMGEGAWAAALSLGPFFGAAAVGALWSWLEARRRKTAPAQPMVEAVSVTTS